MEKQVVAYAGVPVGVLIPHEDQLKFIAVKFNVHALDGEMYRSLAEVLGAIHRLMSSERDISHAA